SVGMPLSFMNLYSISRGMRRNRDPGTRNPLSCPLSKQRMMVCWETLQILAASPVVNTVFMGHPPFAGAGPATVDSPVFFPKEVGEPKSSLILASSVRGSCQPPRRGRRFVACLTLVASFALVA